MIYLTHPTEQSHNQLEKIHVVITIWAEIFCVAAHSVARCTRNSLLAFIMGWQDREFSVDCHACFAFTAYDQGKQIRTLGVHIIIISVLFIISYATFVEQPCNTVICSYAGDRDTKSFYEITCSTASNNTVDGKASKIKHIALHVF